MKTKTLKNSIVFFVILFSPFMWGQNSQEITGKIVDNSTKEVIPGTQLVLLKDADVIKEFFADENGNFVFLLPEGNYDLLVDEFGYEKKKQSFQVKGSPLNLGTIEVGKLIQEKAIEGVTVVGRKTTIVNQIDRKVVTVGDDLASSSQDLSQVMNVIPGVYVNQDNQLSLRGSSNVKVLVDGKPTTMSFEQITKQYPPDMIDKIEVLTNPPAKYSPEGKSGIINIILKKGAKKGTNINVNTSYIHGEKSKYINSIDFNQGFEKFNFFGSAGYNEWTWWNSGSLFRESSGIFQDFVIEGKSISRYAKAGFDYFINDKNTLSLYTRQSGSNPGMTSQSKETGVTGITYINQNQETNSRNQEYDLVYKSEFGKEGQNLEFQANYNRNDEKNRRESIQKGLESGNQREENYRANLDYTLPFADKSEFTAGGEVRVNKFKDLYGVTTTNYYEFSRDIYSLYMEYKKEWDRLGIKAGLRGEYTDTRTESDFSDSQGFKKYDYQLYPTLHTGYKLGKEKKTEISLNYSRRVDRPWAGLFSPVPQISVGTVVFTGNDKIKPEYTNSYEVGISTNLPKLYIGANVFYRDVKDQITQRFIEYPTYIEIVSENTKGNDQYGGEIDINYNPFKWWSINSGFEYYWGKVSGMILEKEYKRDISNAFFRVNNSFTLPKSFNVQVFGMAQSRNKDLQNNYKEQWRVDLSVKKAIMDDQLSFTVRISDLFNTQHSEYETIHPSYIDGRSDWESRRISFSVKYSFASGKIKKAERKQKEDNTKKGGGMM